ncbi:MAG: ribosome-associated translation inhibitor RaiA [Peptococcaceae bacterium]|nr:ribosome-associated translation inhibitor RaiA [Peptococcaceae bacterium]
MNVQVRGRNMDVTVALKEYVEKRLGKLSKFYDQMGDPSVILSVIKDKHRVEVTIPINGMILRGEEASDDMYASIDLVVEKLEKQISKYKGKISRRGKGSADSKMVEPAGENEPKIVRNKRFAVKPMVVDEALLQMNLLGHSFFVFTNDETDQINVLYKRKDGNYGLIEPTY